MTNPDITEKFSELKVSSGESPNSLPTLDLSKALNPSTKGEFLDELRDNLFNYGFFYLSNPPFDVQKFKDVKNESLKFFDIPLEEKKKVAMVNSKHFLGYNGLGDEITAANVDWREQVEFATELPEPVINNDDELYKNIEGPNLWPSEKHLPNFQPIVSDYIDELSQLARTFTHWVEEALGVEYGALTAFFKEIQQAKLKIIKYPDLDNLKDQVADVEKEFKDTEYKTKLNQGVGEHRDNDFLTFIYQASHHNSLQVKDFNGNWIDVPPKDNTLVFVVGMTLEFITQGVAVSTVHRVLTPVPGEGDRLSISFFQTINIESKKSSIEVAEKAKELVKQRDAKRTKNKIGFQFQVDETKPVGYSVFLNRIKSHPKVGERHYPKVLKYIQEEVAKAQDV
ncbi:1-aminocyclopropane-1-carboxylate oxidase 3 [Wickerhamomyces ciferrii]|uniref:1-aminocyclopropane-1-carboxylate oxidase 3 n=1 Tax=Wickerhamomyces ciferrii (strain ATCC 14091 / BCRC 22168 / CBS 111 / JCM 3599 / NBRC 0793 / NRRL Y-1031 F-60-10) TaxID=1206466 RepID=K0KQD2_WICCF|nr:1-aminocyclopropane-1-carboxylate oxidase 3 [Wickerhamomyces ciferrii]CCH43443.1 1-aminocyclopropane-1-carboxylate oxidase 3 [Wickerhamomyces ciferrii]